MSNSKIETSTLFPVYNVEEINVCGDEAKDWKTCEESDQLYISDYIGSKDHIICPTYINGKKVNGIKAKAIDEDDDCYFIFNECKASIIEIPGSYKVIKGCMWAKFAKCVIIGEGIESIEDFHPGSNLLENYLVSQSVLFADSFPQSCPWYDALDNLVILGRALVKVKNQIPNLEVPKGIKEFGFRTFDGFKSLETIVLPDSLQKITQGTFAYCTSLKTIILPNSLQEIGEDAFRKCTSLESIVIPDSVQKIGSGAFANCSSLVNVTIPSKVINLGVNIFKNCPCESTIVLPETDEFIINGKTLVKYTGSGKCIVPDGIEIIGENSFAYDDGSRNETIIEVVLPDSVKAIQEHAFSLCTSLEKINLSKIESIGEFAFYGCKRLTKVSLDSLNKISSCVFLDCNNLNEVVFSSSLEEIGSSAFCGNCISGLRLPISLKMIDGFAFSRNSYSFTKEELTIPKNIKKIGEAAFKGYSNIYVYDDLISELESISSTYINNDCFFDHTIFLLSSETNELKYTVPIFAEDAKDYNNLRKAWNINEHGIAEFDFTVFETLFQHCGTSYYKFIYAFNRIKNPIQLTDEALKEYILYIKKRKKSIAIETCIENDDMEMLIKLEPAELINAKNINDVINSASQKGAMRILSYLLSYQNEHFDTKKEAEKAQRRLVKELDQDLEKKPSETEQLKKIWTVVGSVDNASIKSYKGYEKHVIIPDKIGKKLIKKIDYNAFCADKERCDNKKWRKSGITSITIPAGILDISCTFSGCKKLTRFVVDESSNSFSVDDYGVLFDKNKTRLICCPPKVATTDYIVPETVTHIAQEAFKDCEGLNSITLPAGLKHIHPYAFENCTHISAITIPNSCEISSQCLFKNCKSLQNVSLPENLDIIEDRMFYGCISLTNIDLPNNIKKIRFKAFRGCSSLENIIIPSSVEYIDYEVFLDCTALKTITLLGNHTIIDGYYDDLSKITIIAHKNSAALQFAKNKGIEFEVLESDTLNG